MRVTCDFASTTNVLLPDGAAQAFDAVHIWDGGHDPQVPPQPSSPQVLPVQFAVQPAVPPSLGEVDPDALLCEPVPLAVLWLAPVLPLVPLPLARTLVLLWLAGMLSDPTALLAFEHA